MVASLNTKKLKLFEEVAFIIKTQSLQKGCLIFSFKPRAWLFIIGYLMVIGFSNNIYAQHNQSVNKKKSNKTISKQAPLKSSIIKKTLEQSIEPTLKSTIDIALGGEDNDSKLTWYITTTTNPVPFKTDNRDAFGQEIGTSYGVYKDSNGSIIYIVIEKFGTWGEFTNRYRHYFNANGNLIYFKYTSSHFGNTCGKNDLFLKTIENEYDNSGQLLQTKENLVNEKGLKPKRSDCKNVYDEVIAPYTTLLSLLGNCNLVVE